MTIKLDRIQACNVMRAITAVECDQRNEALITADEEARHRWEQ